MTRRRDATALHTASETINGHTSDHGTTTSALGVQDAALHRTARKIVHTSASLDNAEAAKLHQNNQMPGHRFPDHDTLQGWLCWCRQRCDLWCDSRCIAKRHRALS